MNVINNDWDIALAEEYKKEYFLKLVKFVNNEYNNKTIFPIKNNIFKALALTNLKNVRVVILGQDPYHGYNEAQGLAFSVLNDIKMPPSLRNIFKELENDVGIKRANSDLTDWAKQGVLLLNTVLTVEMDKPLSHKNMGWEIFTDEIIKVLNNNETPIVFILWGSNARMKKELITNKKHLIIESAHPSPLSASRGFFGSKPFSKTNKFLKDNNSIEIRW
ncbi:MAG TPA: uracil-DNA glycosylase [Bacilli bacterium]|nr:uracil-DNA glycosylase [Bacilli bacterium]